MRGHAVRQGTADHDVYDCARRLRDGGGAERVVDAAEGEDGAVVALRGAQERCVGGSRWSERPRLA